METKFGQFDLEVWQYRLWSFQGRDTKLERVLAKNQLHNFEDCQDTDKIEETPH